MICTSCQHRQVVLGICPWAAKAPHALLYRELTKTSLLYRFALLGPSILGLGARRVLSFLPVPATWATHKTINNLDSHNCISPSERRAFLPRSLSDWTCERIGEYAYAGISIHAVQVVREHVRRIKCERNLYSLSRGSGAAHRGRSKSITFSTARLIWWILFWVFGVVGVWRSSLIRVQCALFLQQEI